MLIIKNLTMRNFLSVGNVIQAVDIDRRDLTLILGENLDLGGDGARNGTGKTTMIQALSYALFGQPINNIRRDNLVNRTNGKAMMVTLEFNVNGTDYKIERGRKPNILKFYVNDVVQKDEDTAQGENKATQEYIERVLNITPELFRHIIALNTYSEPFLALKNNEQRDIIEQLMGITLLSEKAEIVKDMVRNSKDEIQQEEFRVKAIEEANKRVREQIESLKRRQVLWLRKHDDDLASLVGRFDDLSTLDIEAELQAHKNLVVWNRKKQDSDAYDAVVASSAAWEQRWQAGIQTATQAYADKNTCDIVAELAAWHAIGEWAKDEATQKNLVLENDAIIKNIATGKKAIEKLAREVRALEDHTCYACGQALHDDQHMRVSVEKNNALTDAKAEVVALEKRLVDKQVLIKEIGPKPSTVYKTEAEAIRHSSDIVNLKKIIEDKQGEVNPFVEHLNALPSVAPGPKPNTHYSTEAEAVMHSSQVANLLSMIESKAQEVDPYNDQIREMENQALQNINFDKINQLTKTMEHQKFLLDLLTNKDSFVRKKILNQNLSYLNARLTHYLDKIGLPHSVIFKNDLTVEITELGREMDFYNLSRGEMNRLILSLSWAFRDVWENLYSPINVLFIDELLDSGLDTTGVENSLAILKDMTRRRQKSIWLVSHREELAGRVSNILKVVKEGGFTHYNAAADIE